MGPCAAVDGGVGTGVAGGLDVGFGAGFGGTVGAAFGVEDDSGVELVSSSAADNGSFSTASSAISCSAAGGSDALSERSTCASASSFVACTEAVVQPSGSSPRKLSHCEQQTALQ